MRALLLTAWLVSSAAAAASRGTLQLMFTGDNGGEIAPCG